jgi:hypothetical protein
MKKHATVEANRIYDTELVAYQKNPKLQVQSHLKYNNAMNLISLNKKIKDLTESRRQHP